MNDFAVMRARRGGTSAPSVGERGGDNMRAGQNESRRGERHGAAGDGEARYSVMKIGGILSKRVKQFSYSSEARRRTGS